MGDRIDEPGAEAPDRESYVKALANLASVLVALAALGVVVASGRPPAVPKTARPPLAVARPVKAKPKAAPRQPAPVVAAVPPPPEPPKLDEVAVGKAEQALDALSRDRARAEARAEAAARRLADAATRAAADARAAKTLAFRVRDPSTRIARASARGNFLKSERDRLKSEVGVLATAPRPRAKVLSNKNPVARPSDGNEFHFELRHNRVSFVDLERLLKLVKSDALLRIRLSDGGRIVDNQVGPVGPFSMHYILAKTLPAGLEDLIERRGGMSYDLRGWEIVPAFEGRGEGYEVTRQPFSEYARAISRLSPLKATVTLWVYPDSFPLFRKLRDDLQARGYVVAARPLPEGMAIRGSPSGSLSAGQ